MYVPKEFEATFELKPIGVKRICEHCNEGEMEYVFEDTAGSFDNFKTSMKKHRCKKCGGELLLPKIYPYIEWVKVENDK